MYLYTLYSADQVRRLCEQHDTDPEGVPEGVPEGAQERNTISMESISYNIYIFLICPILLLTGFMSIYIVFTVALVYQLINFNLRYTCVFFTC